MSCYWHESQHGSQHVSQHVSHEVSQHVAQQELSAAQVWDCGALAFTALSPNAVIVRAVKKSLRMIFHLLSLYNFPAGYFLRS